MKVPFLDLKLSHADYAESLAAAARRVIESGWYVLGPNVAEFEGVWASYCGTTHAIGVASGLDALELLLQAAGIGAGDEVIVPSNTYIATWLAVSRVGAKPIAAAPEPDTFNLDVEAVAGQITPRTRAVIAVHLYGSPAPMHPLRELASTHNLWLFEDAAQAHGARVGDKRVGSLSDGAAFSFYPTKNLGALGDGGIVTTDHDDLADAIRLRRNYGSRFKYRNEVIGQNSRLDEIQAALLLEKFPHLERWNDKRSTIANYYISNLSGIPSLSLPYEVPGTKHVWHVFTVRHPRRDVLQEELDRRGVGTLIFYPIPPHRSEAYAGEKELCDEVAESVADRLANEVLSLPASPTLTASELEYVVQSVKDSVRAAG